MSKDIHLQLEALLRAHLDAQRDALVAAVERIYAHAAPSPPRQRAHGAAPRARRVGHARRPEADIKALAERVRVVVEAEPGIGMTRIASVIGVPSRELERPMTQLKIARRVRSVGRYQNTRYFPTTA